MPDPSHEYALIESSDTLRELCEQIAHCEWFALDTEFIREKTYYPRLCLLQIATPLGEVACIDTLAIDDLSPVADLLTNPCIQKVLHAGSQDMETFCTLCGQAPQNVFDTQIAAPLFGYPEQMGYAALVQQRLGITLSKTQSRTDWAARPLSKKQLQYAADDVIYLAKLFPDVLAELKTSGRLAWLQEEFDQLCDLHTYQRPSDTVWQRLRSVDRLSGTALASAQLLAQWREETARTTDTPKNWLLKDDALIDIARLQPGSADELAGLRGIAEKIRTRYAQTILQLITEAQSKRPTPLPHQRRKKLNANDDALVDLLSAISKLRAAQHSINHNVLAPRKELEKLIAHDPGTRVLQGWRKHFIGQSLQQLLNGELSLSVDANGQIELTKKLRDNKH